MLKGKDKIWCMGVTCSVKNTCQRYTQRDESTGGLMRKCTNQKKYIQDKNKINNDSKKIWME